MDFGTLFLIASFMLGGIVGDAVLFGKTMRVNFSLPKVIEAQGFTQDAAESVFISELVRLSDIPFILPFPTVAQASKDSLMSVVAKPLRIDPLVELLQDKFGSDRVNMKMLMFEGEVDGTMDLHALVTLPNGQAMTLKRTGKTRNPYGLVEAMARAIATEALPYRVALSHYDQGLKGRADGFAVAKDLANRTLAEGFDKTKAQQRAMLFNVLGLIAMHENDPAGAELRWSEGMDVPLASGTARAILATNRAYLALSRRDIPAARQLYDMAMAFKKRPYLEYFDRHLTIFDGVILWGEGDLIAAEERFLSVETFVLGDTALTYRSRLLAFRNRQEEAASLATKAAFLKTIRNEHPDLIGSVFWVDPIRGGMQRR